MGLRSRKKLYIINELEVRMKKNRKLMYQNNYVTVQEVKAYFFFRVYNTNPASDKD